MSSRRKKRIRNPLQEAASEELFAIVEKAKDAPLSQDDRAKLLATIETLAFVTEELKKKRVAIHRLKLLLFGENTETTKNVLGEEKNPGDRAKPKENPDTDQRKAKGHGRRRAAAYTGAERVELSHETLVHGGPCPDDGCNGKVYEQKEPSRLIRVTGMAPISATVYECERLRCNDCGKVFTAKPPSGVSEKKHDESVAAMIATLKYGCGLPLYRLEKLQAGFGVPLPASTQWQLLDEAVEAVEPMYEELVGQAAQAEILYNDDTVMKVLEINKALLAEPEESGRKQKGSKNRRKGTFTSGIIAKKGERHMALFFSGWRHAGENLARVLALREEDLKEPIQMCDALSRNAPGEFRTLLANCLAHGRRRFVEVSESFPDECRYVLETLRDVYRNDAEARERELSPEDRLLLHQKASGPLMNNLESWLKEQFDDRKVEPNSTLGEAIRYMQNHWTKLTLFLREPSAPLDNNICERALKKVILHRKNALFFKTENGARVGDIYMSLIHTTELSEECPFDYLVTLMRHPAEAKETPGDWMPWNYRSTLEDITSSSTTSH